MIWIAREITEEHRRAIDFLNENSGLNMRLYAIQIQAVRIGSSPPAPSFNVVARPNEYSEGVTDPPGLTDTKATYLAFWNAFKDYYVQREGSFLKLRKPSSDYWFDIAVGRAHFWISLTISGDKKRIGCGINISGAIAKGAFQKLSQQREDIERSTGPIEWVAAPDAQKCKIVLYRKDVDPMDRAIWPDLFEWLRQKAELFQKTFAPRIKALPMEDAVVAAAAEES